MLIQDHVLPGKITVIQIIVQNLSEIGFVMYLCVHVPKRYHMLLDQHLCWSCINFLINQSDLRDKF